MVRLVWVSCRPLPTAAHFYTTLYETACEAQVFNSTPSEPDSSIVQRPVK
jgi:hypothetical protein